MIPEEGLKAGPCSFGSSTLYENVVDMGSGTEMKKASCSTIIVSQPKTSRISSPSRTLSVATDSVLADIISTKKSIAMRPSSVPPQEIKQTSPTESRCYAALGVAAVVVFGVAFIVWLMYDSLAKFVSSLMN
uniref:Uncharacterized protein n=1 Tax=Setaria digitata TaxID=48799 RepID=A0A915PRV1_9BILA